MEALPTNPIPNGNGKVRTGPAILTYCGSPVPTLPNLPVQVWFYLRAFIARMVAPSSLIRVRSCRISLHPYQSA